MYKVLWIDDQYDTVKRIIDEAPELYGIEITHKEFVVDGINAIKESHYYYQAVIFDVLCKYDSSDAKEQTRYFQMALRDFHDVCRDFNLNIPYFVCSGQEGIHENEMFLESIGGRKYCRHIVYHKTKYEQIVNMFEDLVNAINDNNPWALRYKIIDKLCNDDFLGKDVQTYFNTIIDIVDNKIKDDSSILNPIRCVLERITNKIQDQKLIPTNCTSFNQKCVFLGKKEWTNKYIPEYIQTILYSLNKISQVGSHDSTQVNNSPIIPHIQQGIAPNLAETTFFMLQCVLDWFMLFFQTIRDMSDEEKSQLVALVDQESNKSTDRRRTS